MAEEGAGGRIFMDIFAMPSMASAQAAIDSLTKVFSKGSGEISKALGKGVGDELTSNLAKAQSTWEATSTRMVGAQNKLINSTNTVTQRQKALSEVADKWGTDSSKYVAANNRMIKANQDLAIATSGATKANADHAKSQDALAASTAKAEGSHRSLANAMTTVGVVATGAFAAGIGVAIDKAGQFQQTQEQLVTTAGLSQKSLQQVSQGILTMAGQVGYSAQDLSKAMYTVSSGMTASMHASGESANALTILKAAAQGAAQEHAPLEKVVDAVTTALKDYNLPASSAADVTSQMIAAVSHGKMTFEDFTGALGQVQASAASAGESMTDLYAAMAQMTSHGIGAEQAAQNLNRALTTFQKPSSQMITALSQVGVNANDLAADIGSKGLTGTLQMVSDAIINHLGPDHKVLISAFNQSQTAAEDAGKAYDALPPKLQAIASQVKAGTLKPTVGALETSAGLGLDEAHQVAQWAGLQAKSTGLSATLTGAKNSDLTYQQMLIQAVGNQETARVAQNLTGKENTADLAAGKADISGARAQGGNVAGWGDVQANFTQKLAEAKGAFGSLTIEMGTIFLPAATKVAKVLADVGEWFARNKTAGEALVGVIGGIAAAFVVWKTISGTVAMVKGIFGGLSTVVSGVGTAAKGAAGIAAKAWSVAPDAGAWIGLRVQAVGNFVSTSASAVKEAATTSAAWVGSGVKSAGAWVATKAAALASFLATSAAAVASAATTAAAWVAGNTVAVVSFVASKVAMVASAVATEALTAAQWLWNAAMDANPIGLIIVGLTALVAGVIYAYNHWTWFRDGIQTVWDFMKKAGEWIGHEFKQIFQDTFDFLKTGFQDTVHAVDDTWKTLGKIVGTPAYYIIKYVYEDGIRKLWDGIAGVFGLPNMPEVPVDAIPHYATGGVHGVRPGYTPGRDTHLIAVGGGEAIMRPEWTRAMGAGYVNAANAAARSGGVEAVRRFQGRHFDIGGIFGDIGGFVGDVGHGIGHVVTGAIDAAKFTAELATDPAGAVHRLFADVLGKAGGTPGQASKWLDTIKSIPGKVVDGVVQKAIDFGKSMLGMGGGNQPWASGAGAEQWAPVITQALAAEGFPTTPDYVRAVEAQIMTESGGNPNIVQTVHDVNWPNNLARGLMQVTPETAQGLGLAGLGGNIYDPLTNLRLGLRHVRSAYGGDVLGVLGHGHGYARGGIVGYSEGGVDGDDTVNSSTTDTGTNSAGDVTTGLTDDTTASVSTPTTPTAAATTVTPSISGPATSIAAGVSPAMDRANATLQGALGHPYTEGGIFDCSGLASQLFQSLIGGNIMTRAFTTISRFADLGFKSGLGGLFSVGVNPKAGDDGHMAGILNGVPFESAGEKGVVTGSAARSITDSMFSDHWYLPGSAWNPAYNDSAAGQNLDQKKVDRLNKAAGRYAEQAKKAEERADKERKEVQKYLAEAVKADGLAAKAKTAASKQRHLDAAAHYRDLAKQAQGRADTNAEKAADYEAKATQAQDDAKTAAGEPLSAGKHKKGKKGKKSSGFSSSGGILSLHDLGAGLGGIAADALTESTGIDSWEKILDNSKIVKAGLGFGRLGLAAAAALGGNTPGGQAAGSALAGLRVLSGLSPVEDTTGTSSNTAATTTAAATPGVRQGHSLVQAMTAPKAAEPKHDHKAKVFDSGGWLNPGEWGVNLGAKPEPVLSPSDWDALRRPADSNSSMKGAVVIEQQHIHRGEEEKYARATKRAFATYQGSMPR